MRILRFAMWMVVTCLVALPLTAGAGDELSAMEKDIDKSIEAKSNANPFRLERDSELIARDFVQQPPLIPHSTKGYNITMNFNKCMDCHSWSRYQVTGATKVSLTHFKDRSGQDLANISPRRYFCTQCHVPQTDANPLVENTYLRADELRR